MNSPAPAAQPASNNRASRRIAAALVMSALVIAVLWITAFSLLTSVLIGSGCCVLVLAASSLWDVAEMLLDFIATVIFAVLALIGAVLGAIFSLFG